MKINGAQIINLQVLNDVLTHPNHAVQGKANYKAVLHLGVVKGPVQREPHSGNRPKAGTLFHIPDDKAAEALRIWGICK
jgi:hypothetical protein